MKSLKGYLVATCISMLATATHAAHAQTQCTWHWTKDATGSEGYRPSNPDCLKSNMAQHREAHAKTEWRSDGQERIEVPDTPTAPRCPWYWTQDANGRLSPNDPDCLARIMHTEEHGAKKPTNATHERTYTHMQVASDKPRCKWSWVNVEGSLWAPDDPECVLRNTRALRSTPTD